MALTYIRFIMDDLNIRNFMPFPFIAHKFRHEIKTDSGYNN